MSWLFLAIALALLLLAAILTLVSMRVARGAKHKELFSVAFAFMGERTHAQQQCLPFVGVDELLHILVAPSRLRCRACSVLLSWR